MNDLVKSTKNRTEKNLGTGGWFTADTLKMIIKVWLKVAQYHKDNLIL
jgi:hypothetical protein